MSNREIAREFECSEKSIRRFRGRNKGGEFKEEYTTIEKVSVIAPGSHMDDPETMIKERGLDPKEWEVERISVNEWDGAKDDGLVTYHQAKLFLKKKKKKEFIFPARVDGWKAPFKEKEKKLEEPYLATFFSDHHAPHHNKNLHSCILKWLMKNKPLKGFILGDLVDFSSVSRHRESKKWGTDLQECIDSGYQILRDYIHSSPQTTWSYLEGNHEERLKSYILDYAKELYGVRPGKMNDEGDSPGALSLTNLLRLDELGIDYVGGENTYEHYKIKITSKLGAIHGATSPKQSGATGLKNLGLYKHSIIAGHCHRQALVYETEFDIDGNPDVLLGTEIGCLCEAKEGLGYSVAGNWQNGFATAYIYPDGRFHVQLANYVSGRLYWGNQLYEG